MDQKKIGAFLKMLRKEKGMTQEQLAEQFGVSGRTVSRWETGYNMPDLSLLVELADFYDLDIREIIEGERSEDMETEMKYTLQKVAAYSDEEKKQTKKRTAGWLLTAFGLVIILSAMTIFPSDSSWGCNYSELGSIITAVGVPMTLASYGRIRRKVLCGLLCFVILLSGLICLDYLSVRTANQVPRFAYLKEYGQIGDENIIVYKAPFYTVTWYGPGTPNERIEFGEPKEEEYEKLY